MPDLTILKGSRIRASWTSTKLASLPGMQMKLQATPCHVVGTVQHIRSDHPEQPVNVVFHVAPQDCDVPDGIASPCPKCGVLEVQVRPEWIVEVLPDPDPVPEEPAPAGCDHGVTFDLKAAQSMSQKEIRERFPRLVGDCPKGCGFQGIVYASQEHFVYGGW